ncbi:MAG: adenylate/guanylate cyclase domain-containing protein [Candidatus Riflebacteria bacterium]|nr:adenylate/guanylate cyclase domain-containing protein [Candidatus Riflebacteria bacterium]
MSKETQKNSGGRGMYLLVLLCFLPILALNLGLSFLSSIDLHWKKQEQKEMAQQEVEALSAGSDFSYQFARRTGNFSEAFKALAEPDFKTGQLSGFLKSKSERIFRAPFPKYDLFTFQMPENGANTELIYFCSDSRPSRRAFSRAFEQLVRVSRGEKILGAVARQNESMISSILGGNAGSDVMARTQRGRPTFAFYQFYPHWFMWDYFDIPGKGTFGFFIFTRIDESTNFAGKLLALQDLRDQKLGYGAFIPLFSGFGGSVFQSPLHRSALLKSWVKDRVSLAENDLKKWLKEGSPPASEIGNYLAFSYLGKGQSHLAVLLLPVIKAREQPLWLFMVNTFVGGALLLLLLRGVILGVWPTINLRLRFTLTYLLAATLPVSMLLISAYGYVVQYRRAIHFQTVSQMQLCIRQFDSRKAQILDEYKSAFAEVVADEKLRNLLKEQGSKSKEARDRIAHIFKNRSQPLPLLSFAIMDEIGEGARFYEGHQPAEADLTFETFKFPIVSVLRKKMREADPNIRLRKFSSTVLQTTSADAYKSMSGNDLTEEIDKRRSFAITRQVGEATATQMHELIKIDGRDRYAVMVIWDDQALDKKIFKHTVDYFGLNNPGFIFAAYRVTPQGLVHIYEPGRHVGEDFLDKSVSLAELAYFRGSYAGSNYDNLSIIAMPSKKYNQTIIVAGAQHFELERSVFYRLVVLGIILMFALFAVIWCSYLSARLFLDPITGLKTALDKVSAGQLNIEITGSSNDELGLLCEEFSKMTHGLREREKLATLISDHAIAALSKASDGGAGSDTESFAGVALVSDIRNFTGMCEQYDPDMVTDLLNEHFAQMTRIISEHGGRIYKFIGDAVEAVFPENDSGDSAAERAFNAASRMIVRLLQINRQRSKNNLFTYRIGIGLAYGKMFAGSIGSVETRLDYAIIGDPVKRAALLESSSVRNPAFPLVVDETIVNSLRQKGLKFEEIIDRENSQAYILSEIGGLPEAKESENEGYSAESVAHDDANFVAPGIRKFAAGSGSGLSSVSVFLAGTIFVILILAGIFWGNELLRDSQLKNTRVAVAIENTRLLEQMKCEGAFSVAFENICRDLMIKIEDIVVTEDYRPGIGNLVEKEMNAYQNGAGRPDKAALFAVKRTVKGTSLKDDIKSVYSYGFSAASMENFLALIDYNRNNEKIPERNRGNDYADSLTRRLFGDKVTNTMFVWEFLSRTVEVQLEGETAFYFYDYLRDRNGSITGVLMFSAPAALLKGSYPVLLAGYGKDETSLAITNAGKETQFSGNFPADLKEIIPDNGAQAADIPANYVVTSEKVANKETEYLLHVVRAIDSGASTTETAMAFFILLAGALAIYIWYGVASGCSVINKSVAARLWLILLVAAVIPLITVFFVSGLYLSEDYNARIAQEKSDLQRFIDLFELRDSFSNPFGWKMVNRLTYASETRELITLLNKASGTVEVESLKAELRRMSDSWHSQTEKLDKSVFNFSIRDIAIAGKGGWGFASSGINNKPVTQFGSMLQQIVLGLMARRTQSGDIASLKGKELSGELAVETGLQIVRSLFGDDVYIRLSHGLGLPVVMNVLSGTVGIVIFPVPSIINPEFIIVWMIMFDYEGYLARVANNYEGSYRIFPAETHRYGTLSTDRDTILRQRLNSAGAMISSSNLPVSGMIEHQGQSWILEGRTGITQMTSMLVALAPEEPISRLVVKNRRLFNGLLLVSLILILFIASEVAADILEPITSLMNAMKHAGRENYAYRIRIGRTDELGALCDSFDTMMKGLEEKMLMGRMLSKTALKVSLKEKAQQSRKATYVFIYIGIPDFTTWIRGMSADQLISDLKNHVANISGIIMGHGGDIDKIIGDRILAVFNADKDPAGAVSSACRAASEIILAENRSELPFPVAVGVNSGAVITGFLGVGEKRDFTVIGDAVNVTARIEGQAEKLRFQRCLISQNVYELASRDFTAREYGEVELKGKSLPLKIYQLTI